ncbi:hypothetical protein [Piscinibacter sp.]|uniref:COG4648 family protein n=1 Tax=Piscinibacter sp. TaxID=1903157 RepID=UPI002BECAA49|nr:hypothetical protein [Albitalea sp.]HUG21952.1 hypothetical protein [Albitalea sp.]
MSRWRIGLGLLLAAAYAVLCHLLLLRAAGQPWTVAVLLGPWLLIGFTWAWRRRHGLGIGAVLLAALGVGVLAVRGGVGDVTRLYLLQHAGIHAALFVSFAVTLRPGRLSLITRVAQHVHGTLAPGMAAYTRRVTAAWALYFIAMATASVVVYAAWPWSTWSLLANVVTPIAIAALFVGEHLLRYRLHPEFERASLVDAIRGYRHSDPVQRDAQSGGPWRRT